MEAVVALRELRELLADEARWTQDTWARRADDLEIDDPDDDDAVCWCLGGAMAKVTGDWGITENEHPYDAGLPAWKALEEAVGTSSLIAWNDGRGRTHEEILAAIDRAIEAVAMEEMKP